MESPDCYIVARVLTPTSVGRTPQMNLAELGDEARDNPRGGTQVPPREHLRFMSREASPSRVAGMTTFDYTLNFVLRPSAAAAARPAGPELPPLDAATTDRQRTLLSADAVYRIRSTSRKQTKPVPGGPHTLPGAARRPGRQHGRLMTGYFGAYAADAPSPAAKEPRRGAHRLGCRRGRASRRRPQHGRTDRHRSPPERCGRFGVRSHRARR
jgi:hypothetical protein